jgi:hypothetical protein
LPKKKIVVKSKEVKTGWSTSLAESSKENYASKRADLSMINGSNRVGASPPNFSLITAPVTEIALSHGPSSL